MTFLEEAGLLETVREHVEQYAFQFKNGAAFLRGKQRSFYDFTEKFTDGPGTTWQVRRADFDNLLAKQAQVYGADIRFGHEVLDVDVASEQPVLTVIDEEQQRYQIQTKFLLDASGFGRILPKLLDLESPSNFPVRRALFTHIEDGITDDPEFDRNKILITVHEKDHRAWYWLIPFADGRASFGVVAEQDFLINTRSKMLKIMNLRQCLSVFWVMNQACHMSCAMQSLIHKYVLWWATQRM